MMKISTLPPNDNLRRVWMTKLAVLVSPGFPVDATKVLAAMLPDFEDYGDEYFTDETRRFVAKAPRRQSVPAYDEICRAFTDWWRSTLPPMKALPAPLPPARVPPTAEEQAAVEEIFRTWKANSANLHRAGTGGGAMPEGKQRNVPTPTRSGPSGLTNIPATIEGEASLATEGDN